MTSALAVRLAALRASGHVVYDLSDDDYDHRHHRDCVAGEGQCVSPVPWPRRTARLHGSAGGIPRSART